MIALPKLPNVAALDALSTVSYSPLPALIDAPTPPSTPTPNDLSVAELHARSALQQLRSAAAPAAAGGPLVPSFGLQQQHRLQRLQQEQRVLTQLLLEENQRQLQRSASAPASGASHQAPPLLPPAAAAAFASAMHTGSSMGGSMRGSPAGSSMRAASYATSPERHGSCGGSMHEGGASSMARSSAAAAAGLPQEWGPHAGGPSAMLLSPGGSSAGAGLPQEWGQYAGGPSAMLFSPGGSSAAAGPMSLHRGSTGSGDGDGGGGGGGGGGALSLGAASTAAWDISHASNVSTPMQHAPPPFGGTSAWSSPRSEASQMLRASLSIGSGGSCGHSGGCGPGPSRPPGPLIEGGGAAAAALAQAWLGAQGRGGDLPQLSHSGSWVRALQQAHRASGAGGGSGNWELMAPLMDGCLQEDITRWPEELGYMPWEAAEAEWAAAAAAGPPAAPAAWGALPGGGTAAATARHPAAALGADGPLPRLAPNSGCPRNPSALNPGSVAGAPAPAARPAATLWRSLPLAQQHPSLPQLHPIARGGSGSRGAAPPVTTLHMPAPALPNVAPPPHDRPADPLAFAAAGITPNVTGQGGGQAQPQQLRNPYPPGGRLGAPQPAATLHVPLPTAPATNPMATPHDCPAEPVSLATSALDNPAVGGGGSCGGSGGCSHGPSRPLPPIQSYLTPHLLLSSVAPPAETKRQNPLYKTELCRSWQYSGSCRYGEKCQFAHGNDELRVMQRQPKQKAKVCRIFAFSGACPFGDRCRFLHSAEELPEDVAE